MDVAGSSYALVCAAISALAWRNIGQLQREIIHKKQCPRQDLNYVPPNYKSEVLLLELAWLVVIVMMIQ
jgi:hypothetical protein